MTLTGDNGILKRATEAQEKTGEAKEIELIKLAISEAQIGENGYQELNANDLQDSIDNQFNGRNVIVSDNGDSTFTVSFLDTLRDYNITSNGIEEGIDWNKSMEEAVAPESQTEKSKNIIGIGTDGRPVNMDLWDFSYYESANGYGLNDEESLNTTSSASATMGYRGNLEDFTEDGQILGTVPQYISEDGGKSYIPVTSMKWTFYNCENLIIMPKIPSTVTELPYTFRKCTKLSDIQNLPRSLKTLRATFYDCASLLEAPNIPNRVEDIQNAFNGCVNLLKTPFIPDSVINMQMTFANCTKLVEVQNLPDKATNMEATFVKCTELKSIPNIPNNVQNMQQTFMECRELINVPEIPYSVTNMNRTFYGCSSLTGIMTINANITGKEISPSLGNDYYFIFFNAVNKEGCSLKLNGSCSILNMIIEESENINITHV